MNANQASFRHVYELELRAEIAAHPQEYAYPIEKVPEVCDRMLAALSRGSANKDSRAIRRTCKELGIKYTYAGIKAFLAGAA